MTEYELLSSAERDLVIARHLREWLTPLGLEENTARVWVDGSKPPARRMFEFQLLKGAGMKACWGFSLDFVPHISAGRLRWHRSNKSARLDVVIDPKGMLQPSNLHGRQRLNADLTQLMPEAVQRAKADWKLGENLEGILELVRSLRDQRLNCFGYEMYVQLPLAFAFLSAKVGDRHDAEQTLTGYIERHHLDDKEATKLRQAAWS
jgi:hypothetical protein